MTSDHCMAPGNNWHCLGIGNGHWTAAWRQAPETEHNKNYLFIISNLHIFQIFVIFHDFENLKSMSNYYANKKEQCYCNRSDLRSAGRRSRFDKDILDLDPRCRA